MSRGQPQPRKPEYRVPVSIPTNWCLDCQFTLRNADEYLAHVKIFPAHNVRPITLLVCPKCGREVELEGGIFTEHWLGYPRKKCPGSGKEA